MLVIRIATCHMRTFEDFHLRIDEVDDPVFENAGLRVDVPLGSIDGDEGIGDFDDQRGIGRLRMTMLVVEDAATNDGQIGFGNAIGRLQ